MIDWVLNVPLVMNVATIIEIILWDFLILYQVFLSLHVKRSPIISNKQSLYEFTHVLLNNLRLRILGNYEKSGKSQKSFTRIVVRKTLFPLKTYSFFMTLRDGESTKVNSFIQNDLILELPLN